MATQVDGALLDTSFFMRLNDQNDPLHGSAADYLQYFIGKNISLYISTLSIAEYTVKNPIGALPLDHLRILPFNINHAVRSGEFRNFILPYPPGRDDRVVVTTDCSLLAQADTEVHIKYFATSDERMLNDLYNKLHSEFKLSFQFVSIRKPVAESFNMLL